MDKFSLNEVVVGKDHILYPELNGMECEIIGELRKRKFIGGRSGTEGAVDCYKVLWANGAVMLTEPRHLRKKKPPEEPATWQEIQELTNWNPTKEVVL